MRRKQHVRYGVVKMRQVVVNMRQVVVVMSREQNMNRLLEFICCVLVVGNNFGMPLHNVYNLGAWRDVVSNAAHK